MKRKHRCDRNHILYQITNVKTGEKYIGLTAVQDGKVQASLNHRWKNHVNRALNECRELTFCKAIREHGPENFFPKILEIVRGKVDAFQRERELIDSLKPELNTF